MVGKSYLKYVSGPESGVVVSAAALSTDAAILAPNGAPIVAVPALEAVVLWNTRTSTMVAKLVPPGRTSRRSRTDDVTSVRMVKDPLASRAFLVIAGYASGYISVWRGRSHGEWECVVHGLSHRPDAIVLCSDLSADGAFVATGGSDTDIAIWDIAAAEPLYRLVGHRGGVVGVCFVHGQALISGSADGLVKVWNLRIQQCVQTITASDTQVTSIAMDLAAQRLFVGVRDDVLKVYDTEAIANNTQRTLDADDAAVVEHGVLQRKTNKPVTSIRFSSDCSYMAVVTNRSVEIFRALTGHEVKKKLQRKKRRQLAKQRQPSDEAVAAAEPPIKGSRTEDDSGAHAQQASGTGQPTATTQRTATEEFVPLRIYYFEDKIRGLCFLPMDATRGSAAAASLRLAVATAHNTVEVHEAVLSTEDTTKHDRGEEPHDVENTTITLGDLKLRSCIDHLTHRRDIRSLVFSSTDMTLLSLSADCIRTWGTRHQVADERGDDADFAEEFRGGFASCLPETEQLLACTGCIDAPPGTELGSCVFLPGDRHVVAGTDRGRLLLVSLQQSEVMEEIEAHPSAAITGLTGMCDGSVVLSCAKDRRLLRWDLTVTPKPSTAGDVIISLQLRDEVELAELPLHVRATPNDKLIAVALQDHNVQVLHADSFKPFITLYGHSLPVTSIAFAADSELCATVSMDKGLRFWGMDFGDCHRAIHAHDDYITDVRFVGMTHYVFTCSMDGSLKHWDGDTWTVIQVVRLHQHGIWAIATNGDGTFIATAGLDRCIRTVYRTQEAIFPEEEEQREAQELIDELAVRDAARARLDQIAAGDVSVGGHRTLATAEAGEALMEALDIVSVEAQRLADGAQGDPHPALRNRTPWEFLWARLCEVKPSEMRHALSSLTSLHTAALLQYLLRCVDVGAVTSYEIAARVLLCSVKPAPGVNQAVPLAIGDDINLLELLAALRTRIGSGLQQERDRLGRNAAGLTFVQSCMASHGRVTFYDRSKLQGAKRRFHNNALQQPHVASGGGDRDH